MIGPKASMMIFLGLVGFTQAFLPPTPLASRLPSIRPTTTTTYGRGRTGALQMGIPEAIEAYVQIWSGPIRNIVTENNIPSGLIKWFHGANMGTVLVAMCGLGTYLGWQIRNGNGELEFTGKTARELHPTLMGLAFLFFFLGGQGGLVLLDVQNHKILESPHAITAFIGIGLLAVQALLPKFFESSPQLRTAHAYLGSATMLLLVVHGALGLNLGFSI